jgi:hypothetical protein
VTYGMGATHPALAGTCGSMMVLAISKGSRVKRLDFGELLLPAQDLILLNEVFWWGNWERL